MSNVIPSHSPRSDRQRRWREHYGENAHLFLPPSKRAIFFRDLDESVRSGLVTPIRALNGTGSLDCRHEDLVVQHVCGTFAEIWPGLLPVIQHMAPKALPQCWISEPPFRPDHQAFVPTPDQSVENPALIRFIREQPYLLVRSAGGIRRAESIREVAQAMQNAGILVLCRHERAVHAFHGQLWGLLPLGAVGYALRRSRDLPQARVVVGTPAGLTYYRVLESERHLLIVPDARDLLVDEMTAVLDGYPRAHVIGLLPARHHAAPGDAVRLRCVYGFEELHLAGPGYERLPVDVAGVRVNGAGFQQRGELQPEIIRGYVWRNQRLNRVIADLVRSVGDRSKTPGAKFGPYSPVVSPLVIVDSVEHAAALLGELPDARFIAGSTIDTIGMFRRDRQRLQHAERPKPLDAPVICLNTREALQRIGWGPISIVIVATQGIEPPAIDPWSLTRPQGSQRRLLFIDVRVGDHSELRARWRRRRRAYAAQEWFAAGTDPVDGRVEQFLAARRTS